jgi:hypothetical protein
MKIETNTRIIQTDFCGQTSLKSGKIMSTVTSQAGGIEKFALDDFFDLPNACQPEVQCFGQANVLTGLMRRSRQINLPPLLPAITLALSDNLFVNDRKAVSEQSHTGQRRGTVASCKQGYGQLMVVETSSFRAKADNDFSVTRVEQEMEAFAPANPLPAATITLSNRLLRSTALDHCRTFEDFIGVDLGLHGLHKMQSESRGRIVTVAHELVERYAACQAGKCCVQLTQLPLRKPIQGPLFGKMPPLAKKGQRDDLTALRECCPSWTISQRKAGEIGKNRPP